MKAKRKPILVRRGNIIVRIYPYPKNGVSGGANLEENWRFEIPAATA
jgi:hypothetical protein